MSDVDVEHARVLLDLRWYDDAIAVLEPLLVEAPDDPGVLLLLAHALAGSGRPKAALDMVDRACTRVPGLGFAHRLRSEILLDLKKPGPALRSARRAAALEPDRAESHWVLERVALARRDLRTAAQEADLVAVLDPGSALAHHACGLVLLRRRKWAEAEGEYRRALEVSPDNPTFLNNLANAAFGQGRNAEAAELFLQAAQLDPHSDPYLKRTAFAARSHLLPGRARLARYVGERSTVVRVAFATAFIFVWIVFCFAVIAAATTPIGFPFVVIGGVVVGFCVRRRRRELSVDVQRVFDDARGYQPHKYRGLLRRVARWTVGGTASLLLVLVAIHVMYR